jgi:hypothetical protein
MSNYSELYNNFYNNDSLFREHFPNLNHFENHAAENPGFAEEAKQIYNFEDVQGVEQNQVVAQVDKGEPVSLTGEPVVKKKEDSISASELASIGSSLPQKPKNTSETTAIVPELRDTDQQILDAAQNYDTRYKEQYQVETPAAWTSLTANTLTIGLVNALKDEENLSPMDKAIFQGQALTSQSEDRLSKSFENSLIGIGADSLFETKGSKAAEDWSTGNEITTTEPIGYKKFNEKVVKELSTTVDSDAAVGINGNAVEFNLLPNPEAVEKYTEKLFNESIFGLQYDNYEEFKKTPSYYVLKNTIEKNVKEGLEVLTKTKEIDKRLQVSHPGFTLENMEEKIRDGFKPTYDNLFKEVKVNAEKLSIESKARLLAFVEPAKQNVQKQLGSFKEKYQPFYDANTQKYNLTDQNQVNEFNSELDNLLILQTQTNQQILAAATEENRSINDKLKDLNREFNTKTSQLKKNYDDISVTKLVDDVEQITKEVEEWYEENKSAEQKAADLETSYLGRMGLTIAKTWYEGLTGFGQILDEYGGGNNSLSDYFKAYAFNAAQLDVEQLNPSMAKFTPLEGESFTEYMTRTFSDGDKIADFFGTGLLTSLKSMPSTVIGIGTALALKKVPGSITFGALVEKASDDALEVYGTYKDIYSATGSLSKAQFGAYRALQDQHKLTWTYFAGLQLLLGKFGKINNMTDALRIGTTKVALSNLEEYNQERFQNYFSEKNSYEIITGKKFSEKIAYEKSKGNKKTGDVASLTPWGDNFDWGTALETGFGSTSTTSVSNVFDTYGQLKRENIAQETMKAFGQKGLSALMVDVLNTQGKKGGQALAQLLYVQGVLSELEYKNTITTVNRVTEYAEVAKATVKDDGRQVALVTKMAEKHGLEQEKNAAETQEKKDLIDNKIKDVVKSITRLRDEKVKAEVSVIRDSKNKIVYADDSKSLREFLEKDNNLSSKVFAAIAEGVYTIHTEDETLTKYAEEAAGQYSKIKNWFSEINKARQEHAKKKEKALKDRNSNKPNTPTDKELDNELHNNLKDITNKYGNSQQTTSEVNNEPVSEVAQQTEDRVNEIQTEAPVAQPLEIPKENGNKTVFNASNETEVDSLIEANKNNDKAIKILNDVKTQIKTFQSLFPQGKIFVHTNLQDFQNTLAKFSNQDESNMDTDGAFINTKDGEIHINLADTTKLQNLDVVAHEITHAILAKAFSKEVKDENGNFLRYETDEQAISDMKAILNGIVGEFGASLNNFIKEGYDQSEKAEEFLAQLGGLLSRAQSPIEQNFVQKVLGAISEFVKNKTGIDVFAYYGNQKRATDFFNYIGTTLAKGQAFDESKFTPVRNNFMIPDNVDMEQLAEGNVENGTVVLIRRSTNNIKPALDQFTKRPGTQRLALDLPVFSLEDKIRQHDGAVLLIMSDNTGFFVNPDTNEFVMGGYGYMAAKKNIEAGVGFASVNLGTVQTTMRNAAACNNGKPVLVLISTSAPIASLGNHYAMKYGFGALPNLINKTETSDLMTNKFNDYLLNRDAIIYNFAKDKKDVTLIKKAKEENDITTLDQLRNKLQNEMLSTFSPLLKATDFSSVPSVNTFIKELTSSKYAFPFRQELAKTILTATEETKINKNTNEFKRVLNEAGISQMGFHAAYGEKQLVQNLFVKDNNVTGQWGSVYGGFTLDPNSDFKSIQSKGLVHPQFNAKVPGYDHFLLDGEYGVNDNFTDSMSFGKKTTVAGMASQGIQPGTRLPDSQKSNKNSLSAEERRQIALNRPSIKRSIANRQTEIDVISNVADQFAKRLGSEYDFYTDFNDNNAWRRGLNGKFSINLANATINTPLYAFSGLFLEMIKKNNITQYMSLIRSLLNDKKSDFYLDLQNNINKSFDNLSTTNPELRDNYLRENTIEKIFDVKSQRNPLSMDIDANELSDAVEKSLIKAFGNMVSENYEATTGIYKALKDIWNTIVEMFKNNFGFKEINVKDIKIPSADAPLWYLANLLSDPRNAFKRDEDFTDEMSNALSLRLGTLNEIKDIETLINKDYFANEDKLTLLEDPSYPMRPDGFITNFPFVEEVSKTNVNNEIFNQNNEFEPNVEAAFGSLDGYFTAKQLNEIKINDFDAILKGIEAWYEDSKEKARMYPDIERFQDIVKGAPSVYKFVKDNLKAQQYYVNDDTTPIDKSPLFVLTSYAARDFFVEALGLQVNRFNVNGINMLNKVFGQDLSDTIDNEDDATRTQRKKDFNTFEDEQRVRRGLIIRLLNSGVKFNIDDMLNNYDKVKFVRIDYKTKNVLNDNGVDFSGNNKINGKEFADSFKSAQDAITQNKFNVYDATKGSENRRGTFVATRQIKEQKRDANGDLMWIKKMETLADGTKKEIFKPILGVVGTEDVKMQVTGSLFQGDVDVSFRPEGGSYGDLLNWGEDLLTVFPQIINKVQSLFQNVDVKAVTFSPVSDMSGKNIRLNLYNNFARKTFSPFYVDPGNTKRIVLPPVTAQKISQDPKYIQPMYDAMEQDDIDPVTSTYTVKRSRSQRTNNSSAQVNSDYESMKQNYPNMSEEEILATLFNRHGHEAMRTSPLASQFYNFYNAHVSKVATEAWQKYADNWNRRQQGITNFVDKYITTMSLKQIVDYLREGVPFVENEEGLFPDEGSMALQTNAAAPTTNPSGPIYKFDDTSIFQALYNMAIPLKALDSIFGMEYRQTIEGLLLDPDFDKTVKKNLRDDAMSYKLRISMDQLANQADEMGFMDAEAILKYINSNLSTFSPTLPALKKLVDKVRKAKSIEEVGLAMNDAINQATGEVSTVLRENEAREDERANIEDVKAIAELASFAGRVLRIVRDLNENKADVVLSNMKSGGRRFSPAFEQHIKDMANNFDKAKIAFEEARKAFFRDFTDANAQKLMEAEKALDNAEMAWAQIMTDPRVQYRFASEVLANRSGLALLSSSTVVMSLASNVEVLARKYGLGNFARLLVDRKLVPNKLGLYTQTKLGAESMRNITDAFKYSWRKSWNQTLQGAVYGQLPDVNSSKFYDMTANVNGLRDLKNVYDLIIRAVNKKSKGPITQNEFADIMQAMLIEHEETGKISIADGKAYTVLGAIIRAHFGGSELMSRMMPFGGDRFAGNMIASRSLLDYMTMRQQMNNKELPQGVIESLKSRAKKNGAPVTGDNSEFFLGADNELERRNLYLMMESLFRDEQNPFAKEGLKEVFFGDTFFTKSISKLRKGIRKGMVSTYESKLQAGMWGKLGYGSLNAGLQLANIVQWTVFPFVKVPTNILYAVLTKTNPLGAAVQSVYDGILYQRELSKFYAKYDLGKDQVTPTRNSLQLPAGPVVQGNLNAPQETLPEVVENIEIESSDMQDRLLAKKKKLGTKEKMEFERELADIYARRKQYVGSIANAINSTAYLALMGPIAFSGAIMPSNGDPDKEKLMAELGVNKNDINVTYLLEYMNAKRKDFSLTPEEFYRKRGGWFVNVKKDPKAKKADNYMNLTNLGTYFGYTLGYLANINAVDKQLASVSNQLTEGYKRYYSMGTMLQSVVGTVFKQTPSFKLVQDFMDSLKDESMKDNGKKLDQAFLNMYGAATAAEYPSITGKPYTTGLAEKPQSGFQIEAAREGIGYLALQSQLKNSRNGLLGLGLLRSPYYKDEIGLFGENLSYRRTISEPGTLLAYLEGTLNFPSLRKGTMVDAETYVDEAEKHMRVRQMLIDVNYINDVYTNIGGDASRYWKLFNRPRSNSFYITEGEKGEVTGVSPNKLFKLPNDIMRDEKRILGQYMYDAMQNHPQLRDELIGKLKITSDKEKIKTLVEEFYKDMDTEFAKAEAEYKANFLANRAEKIIKTMQVRNLLTPADLQVLNNVKVTTGVADVLANEASPRWEARYTEKPMRTYFGNKK